jgi:hypothetical protein
VRPRLAPCPFAYEPIQRHAQVVVLRGTAVVEAVVSEIGRFETSSPELSPSIKQLFHVARFVKVVLSMMTSSA